MEFVILASFGDLEEFTWSYKGVYQVLLLALSTGDHSLSNLSRMGSQTRSLGFQIALSFAPCHLPPAPTYIFYDFWHISDII